MLDGDLRTRLIREGKQRASEYSWRRAAEELLGVYKMVAAQ